MTSDEFSLEIDENLAIKVTKGQSGTIKPDFTGTLTPVGTLNLNTKEAVFGEGNLVDITYKLIFCQNQSWLHLSDKKENGVDLAKNNYFLAPSAL